MSRDTHTKFNVPLFGGNQNWSEKVMLATYKNTEIIKEKASFVVVLYVINQNELARTFLKLSLI